MFTLIVLHVAGNGELYCKGVFLLESHAFLPQNFPLVLPISDFMPPATVPTWLEFDRPPGHCLHTPPPRCMAKPCGRAATVGSVVLCLAVLVGRYLFFFGAHELGSWGRRWEAIPWKSNLQKKLGIGIFYALIPGIYLCLFFTCFFNPPDLVECRQGSYFTIRWIVVGQ